MNIKNNKNESAPDPVMGGIVDAKKFMEKNGKALVVGCVLVLAAVGALLIFNSVRESKIRNAQELFGIGMLDYNGEMHEKALLSFSEVVNNYGSTPIARMSAFMMGSIYLEQDNFDQAIVWFETAANGSSASFVRGQALEGLAAAHESKGDVAMAVKYLERALSERSAAHRHTAVRWKLALLKKDNPDAASKLCREIIADTLAVTYHQKAENLLATLNAK